MKDKVFKFLKLHKAIDKAIDVITTKKYPNTIIKIKFLRNY